MAVDVSIRCFCVDNLYKGFIGAFGLGGAVIRF